MSEQTLSSGNSFRVARRSRIVRQTLMGVTVTAIYAFLQVPGGEASALRLVAVAVAVAMLALLLSEWISRRVAARVGGA